MIDIEKILTMWEVDCQIDQVQLDESSLKFAKIHSKYLSLLSESRLTLKRQEAKIKELRKDKWSWYMGKMTKEEMDKRAWKYDPFDGMTKPLKSDMGMFIDTDKEIQALQEKIDYSQTIYDALAEIMETLKWRSNVVKNILDFRRFTSGN